MIIFSNTYATFTNHVLLLLQYINCLQQRECCKWNNTTSTWWVSLPVIAFLFVRHMVLLVGKGWTNQLLGQPLRTLNTKCSTTLILLFGILCSISSSLNTKQRSQFVFWKQRRNGVPVSSLVLENKFDLCFVFTTRSTYGA